MKKIVATLVGGAAVAASLIGLGAGTANATITPSGGDTAQFVSDAVAAGFSHDSGSTYGVLASGQEICAHMDAGYTPRQVMNRLYYDSHLSSWSSAEQFVNLAASDLCPFHAVQGYDVSRPW